MIPVMALANLAAGAVQGGMKIAAANKQDKQAQDLRKQFPRPTYQIPEGINQATNIARMLSLQGLPGQNLALDQLRQSSASGVRAVTDLAQDPATKAAMAAGLYSQEMNQVNQLNMADAQARINNLQSLGSAYGILAGYQDKKFDINKMQPYDNAMAAASALTGASMQNKMTGTEDIISGVASAAISGVNDVKNAQMAQQIAGQASAQADAAAKVSNLGTEAGMITALGGLGTPSSPTVPVQNQANVGSNMANFLPPQDFDVLGASEQDFLKLPVFFNFAGNFPGKPISEVISLYKQALGY